MFFGLRFATVLGALSLLAASTLSAAPPPPVADPEGIPNILYGSVPPDGQAAPVIIFVHGLGSNATFWFQNNNQMYELAYNRGYRTAFISFNPDHTNNADTIQVNGAKFKLMLAEILIHYNAQKTYVVGHSKGGLDVQQAMLDSAIRDRIIALFTIDSPNQGAQIGDWAFGEGAPVAGPLGLLTPGLFSIRPAFIATLRSQLDPQLTDDDIPVYTLSGTVFDNNPITAITGGILQTLAPEDNNDGMVTRPESLLDRAFSQDLGALAVNHFQAGDGQNAWNFIYGRIIGLESAVSGFRKIATGGLGDSANTWAWSQRWFKGKLYVGFGRKIECVTFATSDHQTGTNVYPGGKESGCEPDPKELPLQAEIWRWTPENDTWERVYQSPEDIPIGLGEDGQPKLAAREIGIRDLFPHEENGETVLYAAGVSANSIYGRLPEFAPDNFPPPRILRSVDGVTWTAIPQEPGTFMGDIIKNNTDINVVGFRSLVSYKGMVFATVTNMRGEGFIIASADPAAGNDAWFRASPSRDELPVWDLAVFNNFLYVPGGKREGTEGYTVHKTDATGAPPYNYTLVVGGGGEQPVEDVRSPLALSSVVHENKLYIGTDRRTEMIRIYPNDFWEIVAGVPRLTSQGYKAPTSGFSQYFGNGFNGHFWQMISSPIGLLMGTWDNSSGMRGIEGVNREVTAEMGFDLLRSTDGLTWFQHSRVGMGDAENYGGRSMESTPFGVTVGTARPRNGAHVWINQTQLDLNSDKVIDQKDVNLLAASIGASAATKTGAIRDLNQDKRITQTDVSLLQTQCTFPGCAIPQPSALKMIGATSLPAPTALWAMPSIYSGQNVNLKWNAVPGAVRYRVYRAKLRTITDVILPGATFTIPGTTMTVSLAQIQSGDLTAICKEAEFPLCSALDVIVTPQLNTQVGFPGPTEQIAIVGTTTFQEPVPSLIGGLYYVRAEDASGNLSEPSNLVMGPSRRLY